MTTLSAPGDVDPAKLPLADLLELTRSFLPDVVRIEDLMPLGGGSSREIWSYRAIDGDAGRELVLRRDPAAVAGVSPGWEGFQLDRNMEYRVLESVYHAGVLVPTPRFAFNEHASLGSGMVTDVVSGSATPSEVYRSEDSATLLVDIGRQLAFTHAIPAAPLFSDVVRRSPEGLLGERIDSLAIVSPIFEAALSWLAQNRPPLVEPIVVHGDYRIGNIMVDASRVSAVLDWEGAHPGQPGEDIGWLCSPAWQYGRPNHPAAGLGELTQFMDAYVGAGGVPLDPNALRYWQTWATLRFGVMCHMMAELHRSGARPSLELAVMGRRACECEYDLLDLMEY